MITLVRVNAININLYREIDVKFLQIKDTDYNVKADIKSIDTKAVNCMDLYFR